MQSGKTYFEQIPVETVMMIATDLPEINEIDEDRLSLRTQNETQNQYKKASSPEAWRQLAQQIQEERDPAKMGELVQQLLDALDGRNGA